MKLASRHPHALAFALLLGANPVAAQTISRPTIVDSGNGVPVTVGPGVQTTLDQALKVRTPDYWLPICFHLRGAPSGSQYDSVDSYVNDQQACETPAWGTVRELKVVYAGFDMGTYGEVLRVPTATLKTSIINQNTTAFTIPTSAATASGSTLTFAAAVGAPIAPGMSIQSNSNIPAGAYVTAVTPSYVAGTGEVSSLSVTSSRGVTGTIASGDPVVFNYQNLGSSYGGQATGSLVPRFGYLSTDPINLTIGPSLPFLVKTNASLSAPGIIFQTGPNQVSLATEGSAKTASANDQSLAYVPPTQTSAGFFGPVAVFAKVSKPSASLLILGDSIPCGVGDSTPDAYGRIGYVQRSLTNQMAWMSLCRGGTQANMQIKNMSGEVGALGLGYFSDVLITWGRNDFSAGQTAAQLKTSIAAAAAPFIAAGKRVWVTTITPQTTSTDGFVSAANQTINPNGMESARQSYNADVRANFRSYGYAGVVDLASIVEDPANPGKWPAPNGIAWTPDGTHPIGVAVTAIAASGILKPSMFANPN